MDSVCMHATDIWKLKGSRQQHVNTYTVNGKDEPRKTPHSLNEQHDRPTD